MGPRYFPNGRARFYSSVHLRMPSYNPAIRHERYSRAPSFITYCLVPSGLTSIDSPNGEVPVPRNPELKTKFPFGNLSALPRAPEKLPKSTLSFWVAVMVFSSMVQVCPRL